MQVNETLSEGLKHEFQVSVPANDLDAQVDARLADMKDKVRMNGFRPGKVPAAHLKKIYGKSVMAETIDQLVRDTNTKIFTERGFRLATERIAVSCPLCGDRSASIRTRGKPGGTPIRSRAAALSPGWNRAVSTEFGTASIHWPSLRRSGNAARTGATRNRAQVMIRCGGDRNTQRRTSGAISR